MRLGAAASLPGAARRRRVPHLPRLARHAQLAPAAGQGRHPLRHLRRPGRGGGAGRAHDLQVRPGGRPVRRLEGRRAARTGSVLRARAGGDHAPLRPRADLTRLPEPRRQRAGARHGHQRARDGLDRRRLPHPAPGGDQRAGLRHRQAGHLRRHSRPDRGDRTRCAVRGARAVPPSGGPGAGRPGR